VEVTSPPQQQQQHVVVTAMPVLQEPVETTLAKTPSLASNCPVSVHMRLYSH